MQDCDSSNLKEISSRREDTGCPGCENMAERNSCSGHRVLCLGSLALFSLCFWDKILPIFYSIASLVSGSLGAHHDQPLMGHMDARGLPW